MDGGGLGFDRQLGKINRFPGFLNTRISKSWGAALPPMCPPSLKPLQIGEKVASRLPLFLKKGGGEGADFTIREK